MIILVRLLNLVSDRSALWKDPGDANKLDQEIFDSLYHSTGQGDVSNGNYMGEGYFQRNFRTHVCVYELQSCGAERKVRAEEWSQPGYGLQARHSATEGYDHMIIF
jgi:hypothetical protein